jgi:hypothetical protein
MKWNGFAKTFLWSAGFLLILTAANSILLARSVDETSASVPEINAATIGSAIACLAGGYLVLLSRFRRK